MAEEDFLGFVRSERTKTDWILQARKMTRNFKMLQTAHEKTYICEQRARSARAKKTLRIMEKDTKKYSDNLTENVTFFARKIES